MEKEKYDAICVDVISLGIVDTPWGKKSQFKAVWETEIKNERGYPEFVKKTYNVSLHEKSNLRKDLLSIRGHDLTDEEQAKGFKATSMKGMTAQFELEDAISKNGNTYLKVTAMHPAGDKPMNASGTYKRWVPVVIDGEIKEAA